MKLPLDKMFPLSDTDSTMEFIIWLYTCYEISTLIRPTICSCLGEIDSPFIENHQIMARFYMCIITGFLLIHVLLVKYEMSQKRVQPTLTKKNNLPLIN